MDRVKSEGQLHPTINARESYITEKENRENEGIKKIK